MIREEPPSSGEVLSCAYRAPTFRSRREDFPSEGVPVAVTWAWTRCSGPMAQGMVNVASTRRSWWRAAEGTTGGNGRTARRVPAAGTQGHLAQGSRPGAHASVGDLKDSHCRWYRNGEHPM